MLPQVVFIDKKTDRLILAGFWLFIAFISYVQDITATKLTGQANDYLFTFIVCLGPLIWIPMTPIVSRLSLRFPFTRTKIISTLLIHLGLALVIALIHVTIEGIFLFLFKYIFSKDILPFVWLTFYINTRILIYFLIIGVTQGLNYFRKFQSEELKTAKLQYELSQSLVESLKMQMQPHFLFNTHNAIVSLMVKNENQKAISMLTKLSELLRFTLDKGSLQMIPFDEELNLVKLYLDIQEIRFANRLNVAYVIDPDTKNILVPVFLCQPLVENAIHHGISPRSDSGHICISAHVKNGNLLCIDIKDDGVGVKKAQKEGIGIGNLKARLIQLYANEFSFDLRKNEPKGTICSIRLPIKTV